MNGTGPAVAGIFFSTITIASRKTLRFALSGRNSMGIQTA